jgi:hypothetical protein
MLIVRFMSREPCVDSPSSCQLVDDFHVFMTQRILILDVYRCVGGELLEEVAKAIREGHIVDLTFDLSELIAIIEHLLGATVSQGVELVSQQGSSHTRSFESLTKRMLKLSPCEFDSAVCNKAIMRKRGSVASEMERGCGDLAVVMDVLQHEITFGLVDPRVDVLGVFAVKPDEFYAGYRTVAIAIAIVWD